MQHVNQLLVQRLPECGNTAGCLLKPSEWNTFSFRPVALKFPNGIQLTPRNAFPGTSDTFPRPAPRGFKEAAGINKQKFTIASLNIVFAN